MLNLASIDKVVATPVQQKVFSQAQESFGFVPNLITKMANAPLVAEAYLNVNALFAKSSLSSVEQQIVLLTVSRFHQCEYCMAAHSVVAKMQSVPDEVVNAIRNDKVMVNTQWQALRRLTENLVLTRGYPDSESLQAFLDEGYAPEQVLEIVLGIALKTLSNYSNHLAETEVDEVLLSAQWKRPK